MGKCPHSDGTQNLPVTRATGEVCERAEQRRSTCAGRKPAGTVERAASPAEILLVNRGYCVARIPAGLRIPSGLGLTNLMTEDAGKCLAEGI